ncbi:MAG: PAS domain S-box protein [Deltaproteobacteria bacterium]|nr:PAS domain S-box protein [Deltaproteobacteria bacterium]
MDRILIVDRDEASAQRFIRLLAADDRKVTVFTNLTDCLTDAQANRSNLIIADIFPLGQTETRFLSELRRTVPDASLVVVTEAPDFHSTVKSFRLGCLDVISKTQSDLSLANKLRKRLKEHQAKKKRVNEQEVAGFKVQKLQAILDQAEIGIHVLDRDYRLLSLNKYMKKLVGVTSKSPAVTFCYDLFRPTWRNRPRDEEPTPCADCLIKAAIDDGLMHTGHGCTRLGRILQVKAVPIKDKDDKVVRVVVLTLDPLSLIRIDRGTQTIPPKLQELLETVPNSMGVTDIRNRIIFANPALISAFKQEKEKLVGQSPAKFCARSSLPRLRRQLIDRAKGEWGDYGLELFDGQGEHAPVRILSMPLSNLAGEYTGSVFLLLGRKALMSLEQELKLCREGLEKESQYRAALETDQDKRINDLMDQSWDMVFRFTPNLSISSANPAAIAALGFDQNELLKKKVSDLLPDEEKEDILQRLRGLGDNGRIEGVAHHLLGKNKVKIPVRTNARSISDHHHQWSGVEINCYNASYVKYLEGRLVQSEKWSSAGRLLGPVTEEIVNITRQIETVIDEAIRTPDQPNASPDKLLAAQEGIHRVSTMAAALEAFIFGRRLSLAQVDINQSFGQLLHLLGPRLRSLNILVVTKFSPYLPAITASPDQINQAVLNLVINAVKFMPSGGTLKIETKKIKDNIKITMSDSGIGLPRERIDRVLNDSLTPLDIDEMCPELFLAQRIINDHYGEINVQSHLGRGTILNVTLPAKPFLSESEKGY